MPSKRRKYDFPTREMAEKAYRDLEQQRCREGRALTALYTKQVHWLGRKLGYRLGIFDEDSISGAKILLVWQPAGQRPHLIVEEARDWSHQILRHYCHPANDEQRYLCSLAEQVLNRLREAARPQAATS